MGGSSADTEYLTDGITETLINGLAQLPNLRVSARSVVFRYKGQNVDAQQVGKTLSVKVRMRRTGDAWKIERVENLADVLKQAGY
jgi:TolB-like protein